MRGSGSAWMRTSRPPGRPFTNFGDELARHILEAVTGRRVRWSSLPNADVVSIGSVLERYLASDSQAAVWGTGLRRGEATSHGGGPGEGAPNDGGLNHGGLNDGGLNDRRASRRILAVRGPLTAARLGLPADTPLGDPGILASMLLTGAPRRRFRRSFVPHFRMYTSAAGVRLVEGMRQAGFTIIQPSLHPIAVVELIAESDLVLSNGLHGLVLAHSLGIPARLVTSPFAVGEPRFKFEDYWASLGRSHQEVTLGTPVAEGQLRPLIEVLERDAAALRPAVDALRENLVAAARDL